ncbi:hypothetical protein CI109_100906 [Kwoniella shandongensis]|uniref:Uncharacterized protein n=1 Tax=Kwoniella shandongensis TaxID=1734106 RepID=A0AAJ8MUF0_9TREE
MHSHGEIVGLEAWVQSKKDKKRLGENGEAPYSQCFIEIIDEPFAIVVKQPREDSSDWKTTLWIDGQVVGVWAWPREYLTLAPDAMVIRRGGELCKADLCFTPLETTDDKNEVTLDKERAKQLGSIVITLEKGILADEKEKKLSYTVKTGEARVIPEIPTAQYSFIPSHKGGITYRFVFNYRPRALLVKMGLIEAPEPPSPPAPVPARNKRKHVEIVDSSGEDEEEDRKPKITVKKEKEQKRIEYLEEQLRLLSDRLRRQSGNTSDNGPIDLTQDDD